jgi:hypothetical protein
MTVPTTIDTTPAIGTPTAGSTVRSEWTKLRTLRSTWIAAIASAIVTVSFAAISAGTRLHDWNGLEPEVRAAFDPTATALAGLVIVVVIFGALGVHHASVEFGTGMIRQTFTATPRRSTVIVAKSVAVAAFVIPVCWASNAAAFLVSHRILAGNGLDDPLTAPGSAGLLVSAAIAAGALAALGAALGALIRRTAAGTATFVAVLLGGSLFAGALPASVRPVLPDAALQSATTRMGSGDRWPMAVGLGLLVLYALVGTLLAVVVVERRDV